MYPENIESEIFTTVVFIILKIRLVHLIHSINAQENCSFLYINFTSKIVQIYEHFTLHKPRVLKKYDILCHFFSDINVRKCLANIL